MTASEGVVTGRAAAFAAAARGEDWRCGWPVLITTVLSRTVVLAVLASLVLWSLAPTVLGWHSTAVMTGSMQPRLRVGDIAVSRPVPVSKLRVGQVLLARDADRPGELRLHRYIRANATAPSLSKVTPTATLTPPRCAPRTSAASAPCGSRPSDIRSFGHSTASGQRSPRFSSA